MNRFILLLALLIAPLVSSAKAGGIVAGGTPLSVSLTDSAALAALLSDETGTGAAVFATSPTLVTPLLGTPTSGTLTNCTGLPAAGVVGTAAILGANTFTGQQILSLNGAASTPPLTLTGTWFSGGSTTTTKPQLLVEPTGTTSTGWTASGTGIGVNAASGFTGNLIDLQVAAASILQISSNSGSASLTSNSGVMIFNRSGSPWAIGSNDAGIGLTLTGTCPLGWANGAATNGPDTTIFRDAANTVALKNAANANVLRIYKTTTGPQYLEFNTGGGLIKSLGFAFTDGAAAQAGTLLNAPTAGNPTKWIPIDDNGTTRYIPAW